MYLSFSILLSNLFWYEFLRFILLVVVLSQRKAERESRPTLMRFLAYSFQKGSSGTAFLLRV
jgi:hypothetical protein